MLMREWWARSSRSDSIEMINRQSQQPPEYRQARQDSDLHQFQYYRTRTRGYAIPAEIACVTRRSMSLSAVRTDKSNLLSQFPNNKKKGVGFKLLTRVDARGDRMTYDRTVVSHL